MLLFIISSLISLGSQRQSPINEASFSRCILMFLMSQKLNHILLLSHHFWWVSLKWWWWCFCLPACSSSVSLFLDSHPSKRSRMLHPSVTDLKLTFIKLAKSWLLLTPVILCAHPVFVCNVIPGFPSLRGIKPIWYHYLTNGPSHLSLPLSFNLLLFPSRVLFRIQLPPASFIHFLSLPPSPSFVSVRLERDGEERERERKVICLNDWSPITISISICLSNISSLVTMTCVPKNKKRWRNLNYL